MRKLDDPRLAELSATSPTGFASGVELCEDPAAERHVAEWSSKAGGPATTFPPTRKGRNAKGNHCAGRRHRGKPWLPFRRLRAEHRPNYPIVVHDRRRLQGPVRFELPQAAAFAGTSRDGSDGTRTRDLRRDRPAF